MLHKSSPKKLVPQAGRATFKKNIKKTSASDTLPTAINFDVKISVLYEVIPLTLVNYILSVLRYAPLTNKNFIDFVQLSVTTSKSSIQQILLVNV